MNRPITERRATMTAELTGPIAHIVTWRLNGVTAQERSVQAQQVVQVFEAARAEIAGLLRMEVGANVIDSPQAWDVALYMVFASHADLQAYQAHPGHLRIKTWMASMKADRGQVDFVITA